MDDIDYEKLRDENSGYEPEAFPGANDTPMEGPANVAEPPLPYTEEQPGPGPEAQAAIDEFVPPVPAAEAAAPAPTAEGPDQPVASGLTPDIINRQADIDRQKAQIEADNAGKRSDYTQQHDEDTRLAYASYLENRKKWSDDLDAKVKAFDEAKLVDPKEKQNKGTMTLAVIFGGLGAGLSAAGGGSGVNQGLETLQKKWHDDTERQKVNIGLLGDKVAMARARVNDTDTAYAKLTDAANAQLISRYNAAISQGEAQLKNLGVNQVDIDRDKRIQQLMAGRAAAIKQANEDQDKHLLNQAKVDWYKSKTHRNGGAGGMTKAQIKDDEAANKDVSAYEARTEGKTVNVRGKVQTVLDIQALKRQLKEAIASGDGSRMRAAALAIQEKTGSILSGGKTTNFQGHLIESPKTLQDNIQENLGKISGNPTAGKVYLQSLQDLLNTVEGSHLEDIDHARDEDVSRLLGAGGKGRTTRAKGNAVNLIKSRYDDVRNPDGSPRYNNNPDQQPAQTNAPATPAPAPSDADKLAEAKRVVAHPNEYSPSARTNAAAYIKSRTARK